MKIDPDTDVIIQQKWLGLKNVDNENWALETRGRSLIIWPTRYLV